MIAGANLTGAVLYPVEGAGGSVAVFISVRIFHLFFPSASDGKQVVLPSVTWSSAAPPVTF